MDKNLKTPEDIDKLIERQASTPGFLDEKFPPVSNNGVKERAGHGKVYSKNRYNGTKRGK